MHLYILLVPVKRYNKMFCKAEWKLEMHNLLFTRVYFWCSCRDCVVIKSFGCSLPWYIRLSKASVFLSCFNGYHEFGCKANLQEHRKPSLTKLFMVFSGDTRKKSVKWCTGWHQQSHHRVSRSHFPLLLILKQKPNSLVALCFLHIEIQGQVIYCRSSVSS